MKMYSAPVCSLIAAILIQMLRLHSCTTFMCEYCGLHLPDQLLPGHLLGLLKIVKPCMNQELCHVLDSD